MVLAFLTIGLIGHSGCLDLLNMLGEDVDCFSLPLHDVINDDEAAANSLAVAPVDLGRDDDIDTATRILYGQKTHSFGCRGALACNDDPVVVQRKFPRGNAVQICPIDSLW
jgi:hypothetical protein